ncbi:uncharacterized protein I206_106393 [Kwoniella pini CBS 10737]|uniref:Uncharacterized protein n=1 Tax=Kwoniella pini CBS 10737 TaxID=1296096 RepID=A0A1B9HU73_9TREE|nr:uncharacterized protein I206_07197 [Kwoniella pini CBS 10737]OCF46810.1 hypothetical protein I206_07197 [Kwoniella pini CBS 10737]
MPDPFGSFSWICSHTVLPQCNLFFSQLFNGDSPSFTTLFPDSSEFFTNYNVTGTNVREDPVIQIARSDAGTGIGSNCENARVGHKGSPGDIALIILSVLSFLLALALSFQASKRKAAVGRIELRFFLFLYGLHSALQVITMSSLLEQGTIVLSVLSSIHVAVIATIFWVLLGNAIIATQVVEDGTAAAIAPLSMFAILFFVPTLYISLDTSLGWTSVFRNTGENASNVKNIALFILTMIWPAVAAVIYTILMIYITLGALRETKPAMLYLCAFILFGIGQVLFFLVSQPLCDASNGKVNSAFLATLLDSSAVVLVYLAWKSITEDDWGEEAYGAYY